MSLYKDASLVMIPSAYKDGKLYSIRPTDGSGDFTFSRGSNLAATRVDVNGLIEKGRENLLLQSNQFDTTWNKPNPSTITQGFEGYDGSLNAWKFTATGTGTTQLGQTHNASGMIVQSIYAKAGSNDVLKIYVGLVAEFNLTTGVASYSQSKMTNVGNGWWRCEVYKPYTTLNPFFTSTGSGDFIYLMNAQTEQGLVATDYIETGASTAQAGILEDMPRLDYSGGASCPSLLLEPSRTNSMLHSEFISTYFFYTNASATNNATTSPEGVVNAASVIPNATSAIHQIASSNISASGSFTLSAFVKAGELNKVAIRESNATGAYASFDLSSGTKIEDNVSGDAFIEPFENDWYRIGVTYTHSGNIRLGINVLDNSYTTGNPSSGTTYWSSNGTDKLYVYGLQCELGATYETSYIPTYGTSQTRSEDNITTSFSSALTSSGNVSVLFDIDAAYRTGINSTSDNLAFIFSDDDRIIFNTGGGSKHRIELNVAGRTEYIYKTMNIYKDERIKVCAIVTNKTYEIYANGSLQFSGTFTGTGNWTSADSFNSTLNQGIGVLPVQQMLYFPTALTSSEAIALTTL